ncbi:MAG: IS982 family transposase [Bacteroidota bacterium]
MTIVIHYHLSGYKCFKYYYQECILKYAKSYFPKAVSYNRFIELKKLVNIPLYIFCFLQCTQSKRTGRYFVDSTKLPVCDNRRIHSHQVLKSVANRGKTSTGWFYGMKLHLVINEKGELISFCFTSGNVADNNPLVMQTLCKCLKGQVYGDAGYVSKKLFEILFEQGLSLLTKIRKNMKNKLIGMEQKYYLKKRSLVETVIDLLKAICDLSHTRHRSVDNCFNNMMSAIVAYQFFDLKPAIKAYNNKKTIELF